MSAVGLRHVRWIGGATGAGKSTVAARLAATFGLRVYSTDAVISLHGAEPGADAPLLSEFREMSMDDRWLRRDPRTMLETFPWFAGERFQRVIHDLRTMAHSSLVLAEGFRLLPRLVQPLLDEPWQGVWFTTTPDFRRRAFERREAREQFWRRTSDPAESLERLLQRDALFGDRMAGEAQRLGLKVIRVADTRTEASIAEEAADWLRLQGSSA